MGDGPVDAIGLVGRVTSRDALGGCASCADVEAGDGEVGRIGLGCCRVVVGDGAARADQADGYVSGVVRHEILVDDDRRRALRVRNRALAGAQQSRAGPTRNEARWDRRLYRL